MYTYLTMAETALSQKVYATPEWSPQAWLWKSES